MSKTNEILSETLESHPGSRPHPTNPASSLQLNSSCLHTQESDPAPTTTCVLWERGRIPHSRNSEAEGKMQKKVGAVPGVERWDSEWIQRGLNKRDLKLIQICYEQQFLTLKQARAHFFSGHHGTFFRRISQLKKLGVLKYEALDCIGSRTQLLRVSQKGRKIAKVLSPFDVPQCKRVPRSTLSHDTLVTSLRLRIFELWDGTWIPERAMKSEGFPQIPDGVFSFSNGSKVAFEFENSLKHRVRYQKLWSAWSGSPVLLVLYVAANARISAYLKGLLSRSSLPVALGLVEWSSLESGEPRVWTPRGELDIFNRRVLG